MSQKIQIVTQAEPTAQQEESDVVEKLQDLIEENPIDDSDEVELDDDGIEIPKGKIPIDGHFSTKELSELMEIAKDEGFLNKDVELQVQDHTLLGDKIIIKDST